MSQISRTQRVRAPLVELEPAEDKIIEAIAFLIAEGGRRNLTLTQYDIVKALFFADKAHLNAYGRPVTFDNYRAMPLGPVPSLAYDLLKGISSRLRRHSISAFPWKRRPAPEISPKAYVYFDSKTDWDEDILSESDVDALQSALMTVKSLTFGQIRRLTHDDPAYIEAWNPDVSLSSKISYSLLFEAPNQEQAETVRYLSKSRES